MKTEHFKHSLFLKMVLILLVGLAFRIFVSCTPPPPIKMDYNLAELTGVDNSGRHMPRFNSVDTMYSDAVAFNLVLYDSAFLHDVFVANNPRGFFAFSKANALSIAENFKPLNKVYQLKIKTLFDIDSDIKAGDDVTSLMLYARGDFELYKGLDYAISKLNGEQYEPRGNVQLVFTKPVRNTMAGFRVDITLDNGREINCVSETFTILTP